MSDRRGFALIGALWLLVALSAVGIELSFAARERRLVALNVAERGQAAWAARAGLQTARARLGALLAAGTDVGDPWWNAAAFLPDTTIVGDASFQVRARDANAALHLNRAGEEQLRALFQALLLDAGDADRLAQAIMDWRDADDLHGPRGAERAAYLEAGAPVLPRNGPLRSVAELLDVRGMTPELFERLRPLVTVTGSGRINLNAAPRAVLLSVPGIGDEAVSVIERRRAGGRRVTGLADLTESLSAPARARLQARVAEFLTQVTFETQELEVTSTGWAEDRRHAVEARGLLVRARASTFLIGVEMR